MESQDLDTTERLIHSTTFKPLNKPVRWVAFYSHFSYKGTEALSDLAKVTQRGSSIWLLRGPVLRTKSTCSRHSTLITSPGVLQVPCSSSVDSVENCPNLRIMWTVTFYSPKHIK